MKRLWKVLRWVAVVAACLFVAAQFTSPARTNPEADRSLALESHLQVNPQVGAIIDRSCADCHSNKTQWPWYSKVVPVSWLVIDHVNHGRSHLNFSEWGRYDRREAGQMLGQICKEVKSGAMPLSSYTPLHPESKLSAEDVKLLCDWTNAERQRIDKPKQFATRQEETDPPPDR
ncbi:MAG TPA: heme-binding domain-containing protein [Pyrinomonadaceae bacterium]|nr:heme-binding domain-containing protein [Pyrinomonadaceae bacterium]